MVTACRMGVEFTGSFYDIPKERVLASSLRAPLHL
jgi:hypothetical protein